MGADLLHAGQPDTDLCLPKHSKINEKWEQKTRVAGVNQCHLLLHDIDASDWWQVNMVHDVIPPSPDDVKSAHLEDVLNSIVLQLPPTNQKHAG